MVAARQTRPRMRFRLNLRGPPYIARCYESPTFLMPDRGYIAATDVHFVYNDFWNCSELRLRLVHIFKATIEGSKRNHEAFNWNLDEVSWNDQVLVHDYWNALKLKGIRTLILIKLYVNYNIRIWKSQIPMILFFIITP